MTQQLRSQFSKQTVGNLQKRAKELGVDANLRKPALVEALIDATYEGPPSSTRKKLF